MYDSLIREPLREILTKVIDFAPVLLTALVILIVGGLLAKVIDNLLLRFFKMINFDKIADHLGLGRMLERGGIKHKPSELLSLMVYWIIIVVVLIMAVKSLGLTLASSLLDKLLAYIPSVISGAIVLTFGMVIAKVVSGFIQVVGANFDLPRPDVLSHLSKLAIMVYVVILFLKEIGLEMLFVENFVIFFGGIVFAMALAFGLAGKDIAAKYLDAFHLKKK